MEHIKHGHLFEKAAAENDSQKPTDFVVSISFKSFNILFIVVRQILSISTREMLDWQFVLLQVMLEQPNK